MTTTMPETGPTPWTPHGDRARHDLLRAFLEDNPTPCPACGYDLRDLVTSRCPECGDQLVLRVGLAQPGQGTFIAGLIGLASGMGFSGLLLIYALLMFTRRGVGGPITVWMLLCAGTLVEGSSIALWVARRYSVARLPPSLRLALVIACWALTLLNVAAFTFFIR